MTSAQTPTTVLDRLLPHLERLAPADSEMFQARLNRWWPDLIVALGEVYDDPDQVATRLLTSALSTYTEREPVLKNRDLQRLLQPDWFQQPDVVGYAAYAERFAGGRLADVAGHIDHLKRLGVSYLHLMPLLQPRPEPNDGGYAVADYRTVRSDLGTMDDLRALAATLHEQGLSLCLDLVLNHVATEHEWATRARAGEQRYRDYFHVFADRTVPDQYELTLPEIFPDFAPGNFTWDDPLQAWVWTTFNSYQWDLNWANPDVLAEMTDVVLFLANVGVDILRLDAIAFIWKRMGTTCQNEPEVHAITQALRTVLRIAAPGVILLAEAIVAPTEIAPYLGQGRHHGKVSDLAYHNSLMVQYWSMLATRDTRLAVYALRAIPAIPSTTAWLTYIRCHDDIGWAVMNEDAEAVGANGFEHRKFLSDFYSGTFGGSFAEGLVFQENPITLDRRISGAAASLCGLDKALDAGDPFAAKDAAARLVLGHALVCFWGGIPVIWYGDEVATRNDPHWADEPGHEADNRWVHRPRLRWDEIATTTSAASVGDVAPGQVVTDWPAGDVTDEAARAVVWQGLQRVLGTRARLPHLHASTPAEPLSAPDPAVLAVRRAHPLGVAVGLFNMSEHARQVPTSWLYSLGVDLLSYVDALSGGVVPQDEGGHQVLLPPYGSVWLVDRAQLG